MESVNPFTGKVVKRYAENFYGRSALRDRAGA